MTCLYKDQVVLFADVKDGIIVWAEPKQSNGNDCLKVMNAHQFGHSQLIH